MSAQQPHEFLEWFQARPHSRVPPLLQVNFGAGRLLVVPEQLKDFFQVVGSHDRRVPLDQRRKAVLLAGFEIPWILQQQPATPFEDDPFFRAQAPHLTAPDFLDRFIEMFDDVKPIEQDLRVPRVLPYQAGVRRR